VVCEVSGLESAPNRGAITSLAVANAGQIYVGTSTGQISEYRLVKETERAVSGASVSLTACTTIGKKTIEVPSYEYPHVQNAEKPYEKPYKESRRVVYRQL
jgi:hypothetical protein